MAGFCPRCLFPIGDKPGAAVQPAEYHCPECGHVFSQKWLDTISGLFDRGGESQKDDSDPIILPLPDLSLTFGPYEVQALIGKGGMGVVYQARHQGTGEEVAIKTVRAATQGLLQRIRREVLAMSRARHPGLVRFIATGLGEAVPWYGMELLKGRTLHDFMLCTTVDTRSLAESPSSLSSAATIAKKGPKIENRESRIDDPQSSVFHPRSSILDPHAKQPRALPDLSSFLTLMARVCSALAYLHGEGVVHRDLKPKNIIIRPDGTPVIVDFGVASRFGAVGRETLEVSGKVEGTPAYMAPEQIRGEYVDARADLYSVGCILYEGVTGRVPFSASRFNDVLEAHVHSVPVAPSELVENVSPVLESLIVRLLAKNPRDRLGHARDVVSVLVELGADAGNWLVENPARDYLYRPRFVGRDQAMVDLRKYIRQAHVGENRCMFLRGESGVGKTRVIQELARTLENAGVRVFTGECLPVNVATPNGGPEVRAGLLHPFRPLLQAIADRCLESGQREFDRLIGPRAGILAAIEPNLGRDGIKRTGQTQEAGPGRSHQLLDALGQTLVEFARRVPCVLFLDDLQWADELTLKFLDLLQAGAWESAGLAVVASYRSEEEHAALRLYRHLFTSAPLVKLDRFDEVVVGELVRDMLGVDDMDHRFVQFLAQRSEGNPFFVAEYLRTTVAEGLLRRDQSGRWRLAPLADLARIEKGDTLDQPGSLRQLVGRKLEGLPGNARTVVELAAVLGRDLDGNLLQAVSLLDEADFFDAVTALVTRQVLVESQAYHFRFDHDKLREIAYEQVPVERRRELHRQVATATERRYSQADDYPHYYPALAHHWRRSLADRLAEPEATARAVDYLEKAAQQALMTGLLRQAVEFGLEAARLLGVEVSTDAGQIGPALGMEMQNIGKLMGTRSPADLLHLPTTATPDITRVIGIFLSIQPAAYNSHQLELFALLAAKNMGLILQHGQTPLSPCVYSMFAIITLLLSQDHRAAYAFSSLALALDQQQGGQFTGTVSFVHTWFINHWQNPLTESLPISLDGARAGFQTGDILYGCYNQAAHVVYLSYLGAPLDQVIAVAREHHRCINNRVGHAAYHCVLEMQFAKALAGQTQNPLNLSDAEHDEARDLEAICKTDNFNQITYYFIARLRLEYYYRNYRAALEFAERALPLRAAFQGQVAEIDFCFFHALALVAHVGCVAGPNTGLSSNQPTEGTGNAPYASGATRGGEERNQLLTHARAILDQLDRWSEACPANSLHKSLLVRAELASLENRAEEISCYDEAAACALQSGYPHHAALAKELAGAHYLRHGQSDLASGYLAEACQGYRDWGATAKVQDVRQQSHELR
jgi:predicted ATPase/serine/threonine protein kinase